MKISVDHHNKVQRGKRAKKDACTTFREKVAPRQYRDAPPDAPQIETYR